MLCGSLIRFSVPLPQRRSVTADSVAKSPCPVVMQWLLLTHHAKLPAEEEVEDLEAGVEVGVGPTVGAGGWHLASRV